MRTRMELFVLLLAFWLLLSDHREPLFLVMGVLSAGAVAWLLGDFFATTFSVERPPLHLTPLRLWRTARYLAWLLWRVFLASLEVAWVVIHPHLPIEPGFVRFRTGLRSPLARATLANSITLVPGTLTVRVLGDEFLVHSLWPGAADDLRSGAMQRRIAAVFLEPAQEGPVDTEWEPEWTP